MSHQLITSFNRETDTTTILCEGMGVIFFQKLTSFTDGGADRIDGVAWRRLAVARLAGEKKKFFFHSWQLYIVPRYFTFNSTINC